MNILFDINHPAHVHLYKNPISILKKIGHNIVISAKSDESIIKLLDTYGFKYYKLGEKKQTISGKIFDQVKFDWQIYKIAKKHLIDLSVGTSISICHLTKISKIPSILLDDDDDEVQPLFVKYAHPYCSSLLSPDCLKNKRKRKDTIYYSSLHELAYLHPKYFKPDQSVLSDIGLSVAEPYFLLRFNRFKAHHDRGVQGLSLKQKHQLINILTTYGKVYITSEGNIESEMERYKLPISPEKIHSLLYYSTMFIGDSQTMTSEAAILGIPSIRCNTLVDKISYLDELEHKYGLTYGFKPENFNKLLSKLLELLNNNKISQEWQEKRKKLLNNKIDITAFLVWFIENYPESKKIMDKNPVETQIRFI